MPRYQHDERAISISHGIQYLKRNMVDVLRNDRHRKAFLRCVETHEFVAAQARSEAKTQLGTFTRFAGHLLREGTLVADKLGLEFVDEIASYILDVDKLLDAEEAYPDSWHGVMAIHVAVWQVGRYYMNIAPMHCEFRTWSPSSPYLMP